MNEINECKFAIHTPTSSSYISPRDHSESSNMRFCNQIDSLGYVAGQRLHRLVCFRKHFSDFVQM